MVVKDIDEDQDNHRGFKTFSNGKQTVLKNKYYVANPGIVNGPRHDRIS